MLTVAPKWHKDFPDDAVIVDTTSHGNKSLSPFYLGPVVVEPFKEQYYVSRNMENAWQYSKCYAQEADNLPGKWLRWATQGWSTAKAERYPKGKGAVPEYSVHQGKRLGYIEARKLIYGPLYMGAVVRQRSFIELLKDHRAGKNIWMLDFDARITDATHDEILNDPEHKMGHAYWLKHALEVFA